MSVDFLKTQVYPALSEHLDAAFPEFNFRPDEKKWWIAQDAPDAYAAYGHKQRKLVATGWGFQTLKVDKPPVTWLMYLNGGTWPRGEEFWNAVETLCEMAGVKVPSNNWTPEQKKVIEKMARRPYAV